MNKMNTISFSYENPLAVRFGEDFFKAIPTSAGVYFFLDENKKPLYIGKADNLRKRLVSYRAAKPGQTQEHILEMIENADSLRWEIHKTGEKALIREAMLIRSLAPRFNIVGTGPGNFLFCGIKVGAAKKTSTKHLPVEFRLSHTELDEDFTTYGCFPHRGKTKAGYSALLRLIYTICSERERFALPAKLCRTSPAYVHEGIIPADWTKPLQKYLSGESSEILSLITRQLLEQDNIPAYLYAPLQRDLNAAKIFFEAGPQATRKLARMKNPRTLKHSWISQSNMQKLLRESIGEDYLRNSLTVS